MIAFKKASRVAREAPYKNKKKLLFIFKQSILFKSRNKFIYKKIDKKLNKKP
jgi:hypothetical protein